MAYVAGTIPNNPIPTSSCKWSAFKMEEGHTYVRHPTGYHPGPMLFLLYVNDMPEHVHHSTMKFFADDAKVYRNIATKDDCVKLQEDLDSLNAWTKNWLLRFNAGKCSVLRIRPKIPHTYYIDGLKINHKEVSQKDLGITVSNNLKPTKRVSNTCNKANQRIYRHD